MIQILKKITFSCRLIRNGVVFYLTHEFIYAIDHTPLQTQIHTVCTYRGVLVALDNYSLFHDRLSTPFEKFKCVYNKGVFTTKK